MMKKQINKNQKIKRKYRKTLLNPPPYLIPPPKKKFFLLPTQKPYLFPPSPKIFTIYIKLIKLHFFIIIISILLTVTLVICSTLFCRDAFFLPNKI